MVFIKVIEENVQLYTLVMSRALVTMVGNKFTTRLSNHNTFFPVSVSYYSFSHFSHYNFMVIKHFLCIKNIFTFLQNIGDQPFCQTKIDVGALKMPDLV